MDFVTPGTTQQLQQNDITNKQPPAAETQNLVEMSKPKSPHPPPGQRSPKSDPSNRVGSNVGQQQLKLQAQAQSQVISQSKGQPGFLSHHGLATLIMETPSFFRHVWF